MQVVRFESYSQGKVKLLGFFILAGLACILFSIFGSQHLPIKDSTARLAAIAIPFLVGGYLVQIPLSSYLKNWSGNRSEDLTEKALASLGDDYVLVRNWKPRSDKGDIDLILFGSFGAVILECKFSSKKIECNEDKWHVVLDRGYRKPIKSYSNQLKRQIALASKSVPAPVTGTIVFNDSAKFELKNPTVSIIKRKEVMKFITELGSGNHTGQELWEKAKATAEAAELKHQEAQAKKKDRTLPK